MKKRSWVDVDREDAGEVVETAITNTPRMKTTTVTRTKKSPKRTARTLWETKAKVHKGLTVETMTTVIRVTTTHEWSMKR